MPKSVNDSYVGNPESPKFFNTREASLFLRERTGCKRVPGTLEKLRVDGSGPPFIRDLKSGEIWYPEGPLLEWGRAQMTGLLRSTSEYDRPIIPAGPGRGHRKPAPTNPPKPEPARRSRKSRVESVEAAE